MIKLNEQIVEQNHFPDGSLRCKIPMTPYTNPFDGVEREILIKDGVTITWYYENDSEFFKLHDGNGYVVTEKLNTDSGEAEIYFCEKNSKKYILKYYFKKNFFITSKFFSINFKISLYINPLSNNICRNIV